MDHKIKLIFFCKPSQSLDLITDKMFESVKSIIKDDPGLIDHLDNVVLKKLKSYDDTNTLIIMRMNTWTYVELINCDKINKIILDLTSVTIDAKYPEFKGKKQFFGRIIESCMNMIQYEIKHKFKMSIDEMNDMFEQVFDLYYDLYYREE